MDSYEDKAKFHSAVSVTKLSSATCVR
jgi:hypothetical protein